MNSLTEERICMKLDVALTAAFLYSTLATIEIFMINNSYHVYYKVFFWLVYSCVLIVSLGLYMRDKRCAVVLIMLFLSNVEQFLIYDVYIEGTVFYLIMARLITSIIIIIDGILPVLLKKDEEPVLAKRLVYKYI